jgi:pentatricopeptide repeat protein
MGGHPRFGELLSEGISSVARRQMRTIEVIEEEIAQNLGYTSHHIVEHWRRGNLPGEETHIEYLATYCMRHGRVNEAWANELLQQAGLTTSIRQLDHDIRHVPNNLPTPAYTAFIGRKTEMARLLELLSRQRGANLISVDGIGGVGKTTLALEAAWRCHHASTGEVPHPQVPTFDAIIFASAKQQYLTAGGIMHRHQAQRTLQDIFREIARTLNRPDIMLAPPHNPDQPEHEDTQFTRVLEALRHQRTLLIVDNLETMVEKEIILDFLFDLPPSVKAIITTRERATFSPIRLNELLPKEGLDLIAREAKDKAVSLTDDEAQTLYKRTGGVPAAIMYAVGQMSLGYSPQSVLDRVSQATGEVARFCFAGSVAPLRTHPPHRLLMVLAMFPKRPLHSAVVEAAELTSDLIAAAEGLRQLQQLSLVSQRDGRYSMLPLTREYALAELAAHPDFERDARERWVRWYLDFAKTHGGFDWMEWQIQYDQLEDEWENLLAVFAWCAAQERYDEILTFWQGTHVLNFASIYGYWHDRLSWLDWLIQAAERRGDWASVVEAMSDKGFTLALMGHKEQRTEADTLLKRAWDLREQTDLRTQADLAHNVAVLRIRQENYADALEWVARTEALHSEAQLGEPRHSRGWISFSYYRAVTFFETKKYDEAKRLFQEIIERGLVINWQRAIVYAQNWLADIAIARGELDEAERLLQVGLPVAERNKDKRRTAFYRRSFAHLARARGDKVAMRRWAGEARDGFDRLGMQPEMREMYDLENA